MLLAVFEEEIVLTQSQAASFSPSTSPPQETIVR
jgi:hypothetical protein